MNSKLAWDDLKLVLAVGDSGSLSGAGRELGVSHATVFRHLNGMEARLGVTLFERSRSGYSPTVAGSEAITAARRIASEIFQVERRLAGQDHQPCGTVRITTTDSLFAGLLSPILQRFRKANPGISVEVAVSNQVLNLSHREADIALRPSNTPLESLVGRRVGTIEQAVYARRDLYDDVIGSPWIGPDESLFYVTLNQWMSAQGLDADCRYRVDTVLGMKIAACDGMGVAVLPCYLGDSERCLVRMSKPVSELATELWLLTHQDLRKTTRVKTLLDFVAQAIRAEHTRLAGKLDS